MVRDEYPVIGNEEDEEDKEDTVQEAALLQGNDNGNVDEEMECEEYLNDINGFFENVLHSTNIGIEALENQLDHLETALDHLEKKNDDIHAKLVDLLQSNREARKQFQESPQDCEFDNQTQQ